MTESSQSRGVGGGGGGGGGGEGAFLWCLALTSMSRRFLQRWYDIRGGEENASRHLGIVVKNKNVKVAGNDLRRIRLGWI